LSKDHFQLIFSIDNAIKKGKYYKLYYNAFSLLFFVVLTDLCRSVRLLGHIQNKILKNFAPQSTLSKLLKYETKLLCVILLTVIFSLHSCFSNPSEESTVEEKSKAVVNYV
jgi:hypothetical protein